MTTAEEGVLLRIFVSENDKLGGASLYQRIVEEARKLGLSGATVLRGMMGFGAGSEIHMTKWVRLSDDLPVVVEIVDSEEQIDKLMPNLRRVIGDGFVTIEKVRYLKFRKSKNDD